MFTKKIAAMLVAAVMIFSAATPAFAEDSVKYIERDGKTYVQVSGLGTGAKGANSHGNFSKRFAMQAAKMDALRQLAEIIQGVETDPKIQEDQPLESVDEITVRLDALPLANVRQIYPVEFEEIDGGILCCKITMEIPFLDKK